MRYRLGVKSYEFDFTTNLKDITEYKNSLYIIREFNSHLEWKQIDKSLFKFNFFNYKGIIDCGFIIEIEDKRKAIFKRKDDYSGISCYFGEYSDFDYKSNIPLKWLSCSYKTDIEKSNMDLFINTEDYNSDLYYREFKKCYNFIKFTLDFLMYEKEMEYYKKWKIK